jgi:hypothetical protein
VNIKGISYTFLPILMPAKEIVISMSTVIIPRLYGRWCYLRVTFWRPLVFISSMLGHTIFIQHFLEISRLGWKVPRILLCSPPFF